MKIIHFNLQVFINHLLTVRILTLREKKMSCGLKTWAEFSFIYQEVSYLQLELVHSMTPNNGAYFLLSYISSLWSIKYSFIPVLLE